MTKNRDHHEVRVKKKTYKITKRSEQSCWKLLEMHTVQFSPGPTQAEAVGITESSPGHSKAGTFGPRDRKSEHLREESCRGSMRPEQSFGSKRHSNRDLENFRGSHEMYTAEESSKDPGAL